MVDIIGEYFWQKGTAPQLRVTSGLDGIWLHVTRTLGLTWSADRAVAFCVAFPIRYRCQKLSPHHFSLIRAVGCLRYMPGGFDCYTIKPLRLTVRQKVQLIAVASAQRIFRAALCAAWIFVC
jgi:hypothetical protein